MWYKNIAGSFFGLVTKHPCDRRKDGRTNIQNYDSQDRASIAASRGNKKQLSRITVSLSALLSKEFLKFSFYRVARGIYFVCKRNIAIVIFTKVNIIKL